MANIALELLGKALELGVQEAGQYESEILALLAAENVTIEKAVDAFVDGIKVGGALGLILPAIKPALIAQANAMIASQAATQEKIVFDMIVAAAKAEAAKLVAA